MKRVAWCAAFFPCLLVVFGDEDDDDNLSATPKPGRQPCARSALASPVEEVPFSLSVVVVVVVVVVG